MTTPDYTDKIIVVTGASRGIGRSACVAFAKAGAHVVAIAKTQGALEELDDEINDAGGKITLIAADITNEKAMDQLAPALTLRFGRIDGLILNAGILGELAPVTDLDRKTWDLTLATNLTANWNLLRQLDPLLRHSSAPRVVFVSTGTVTTNKAFWGAYTVSKAGLEALAMTYAHETEAFGIRVSILNPGATRTRMRAKAMPGEDPETLPHPDAIAPLILHLASPDYNGIGERFNFRDWHQQQV